MFCRGYKNIVNIVVAAVAACIVRMFFLEILPGDPRALSLILFHPSCYFFFVDLTSVEDLVTHSTQRLKHTHSMRANTIVYYMMNVGTLVFYLTQQRERKKN